MSFKNKIWWIFQKKNYQIFPDRSLEFSNGAVAPDTGIEIDCSPLPLYRHFHLDEIQCKLERPYGYIDRFKTEKAKTMNTWYNIFSRWLNLAWKSDIQFTKVHEIACGDRPANLENLSGILPWNSSSASCRYLPVSLSPYESSMVAVTIACKIIHK